MNEIFIALTIGIIAGIIDVIPMIIRKMDKFANLSAFSHWVVLGLLIPFISWNIAPWLKGLIIAEITAIPILFMVAKEDKKADYSNYDNVGYFRHCGRCSGKLFYLNTSQFNKKKQNTKFFTPQVLFLIKSFG